MNRALHSVLFPFGGFARRSSQSQVRMVKPFSLSFPTLIISKQSVVLCCKKDDGDEKNNSTPPPPPCWSELELEEWVRKYWVLLILLWTARKMIREEGEAAKAKKKQEDSEYAEWCEPELIKQEAAQEEEEENKRMQHWFLLVLLWTTAKKIREEEELNRMQDAQLEAEEAEENKRKEAEEELKRMQYAQLDAEEQAHYERNKEADLKELLDFIAVFFSDMRSKVPPKGIARKGRSVADSRTWKACGFYAYKVSKKELKIEKDGFTGSVSSGRRFIIEFKVDACTARWDEEGSPELWRMNYFEAVAQVDREEEEKRIGTSGGGGGGVGGS